jgi:hypothetical protein
VSALRIRAIGKRRGAPHATAWSLVAGLVCVACTTPHPYTLAPGASGAAARSLVVFPVNVVLSLPSELEPSSERADAAIRAYLVDAHGKEISTPRVLEARDLWMRSIREAAAAGEGSDFSDAVRILARGLRESGPYDALVIPSLLYRPARMSGYSVQWDGVSRRVPVNSPPQRVGSIHVSTSFSGQMDAVSLHVLVYDVEGRELFESFGGLDLAHEVEVWGNPQRPSETGWDFVLRPDPLEDPALLREGIAIAFDPYLPIVEPEPR